MKRTPKSLRLHIGVFGRTNVGKSSFLNMVSGQDVSITSPVAGTTTDVVEKTMELLPVGPVVFLDTGGLDDVSELAVKRIEKTGKIFRRADIICLVLEAGQWGPFEDKVVEEASRAGIPVIGVINKSDLEYPREEHKLMVGRRTSGVIVVSSVTASKRDEYLAELKKLLIDLCPEDFIKPPPLIGDLLPAGGVAVLIVPIDLQAPKGRLILPQVQVLRDVLDADAMTMVVKEREYRHALSLFRKTPDLAVCDSQVVMKMVADTPPDMKCTTFSILFSRYKGDLEESVKGAIGIERLRPGSRVLIAESCSHHAIEDDIGRVKIPRWVRQYTGHNVEFEVYSGKDYPDDLANYDLVIHCGGCMTNRREMLYRINFAKEKGVPVTNYGVCISYVQGVLGRALSPFSSALYVYERERARLSKKGRS
jgi:[FeFe] hydrogenase H-cluster maturation GTPase HydF